MTFLGKTNEFSNFNFISFSTMTRLLYSNECKGRGPMKRASRNRALEEEGGHSPTDVEGALLREVRQRGPLPA